jgi:hypothetical protein
MASSFGIQTGSLSAVNNYTDDAKVQDVLLKFYDERGLGAPDAPPAEKLQAIVDYLERFIVNRARRLEYEQRQEAIRGEVEEEYDLK